MNRLNWSQLFVKSLEVLQGRGCVTFDLTIDGLDWAKLPFKGGPGTMGLFKFPCEGGPGGPKCAGGPMGGAPGRDPLGRGGAPGLGIVGCIILSMCFSLVNPLPHH